MNDDNIMGTIFSFICIKNDYATCRLVNRRWSSIPWKPRLMIMRTKDALWIDDIKFLQVQYSRGELSDLASFVVEDKKKHTFEPFPMVGICTILGMIALKSFTCDCNLVDMGYAIDILPKSLIKLCIISHEDQGEIEYNTKELYSLFPLLQYVRLPNLEFENITLPHLTYCRIDRCLISNGNFHDCVPKLREIRAPIENKLFAQDILNIQTLSKVEFIINNMLASPVMLSAYKHTSISCDNRKFPEVNLQISHKQI